MMGSVVEPRASVGIENFEGLAGHGRDVRLLYANSAGTVLAVPARWYLRSADSQQLHLESQLGLWRDNRRMSAVAISKVRRDD
jgi:hypothetical protein